MKYWRDAFKVEQGAFVGELRMHGGLFWFDTPNGETGNGGSKMNIRATINGCFYRGNVDWRFFILLRSWVKYRIFWIDFLFLSSFCLFCSSSAKYNKWSNWSSHLSYMMGNTYTLAYSAEKLSKENIVLMMLLSKW